MYCRMFSITDLREEPYAFCFKISTSASHYVWALLKDISRLVAAKACQVGTKLDFVGAARTFVLLQKDYAVWHVRH